MGPGSGGLFAAFRRYLVAEAGVVLLEVGAKGRLGFCVEVAERGQVGSFPSWFVQRRDVVGEIDAAARAVASAGVGEESPSRFDVLELCDETGESECVEDVGRLAHDVEVNEACGGVLHELVDEREHAVAVKMADSLRSERVEELRCVSGREDVAAQSRAPWLPRNIGDSPAGDLEERGDALLKRSSNDDKATPSSLMVVGPTGPMRWLPPMD